MFVICVLLVSLPMFMCQTTMTAPTSTAVNSTAMATTEPTDDMTTEMAGNVTTTASAGNSTSAGNVTTTDTTATPVGCAALKNCTSCLANPDCRYCSTGMSLLLSGIGNCQMKTENCSMLQTTADAPATEKNCPYDNALRCKKLSCPACVADSKCVWCDTFQAGLSQFSSGSCNGGTECVVFGVTPLKDVSKCRSSSSILSLSVACALVFLSRLI